MLASYLQCLIFQVVLLSLKSEDVELCFRLNKIFHRDVTVSDWERLNEIVDLQSSEAKYNVVLRGFEDYWSPSQHCQKCNYKHVKTEKRFLKKKYFWNVYFSAGIRIKCYILYYILKYVIRYTSIEWFSEITTFYLIGWIVYLNVIWEAGFLIADLVYFAKSMKTMMKKVARNEIDNLTEFRVPSSQAFKLYAILFSCLVLFDFSMFPLKYDHCFSLN
jgi:hypothetical protein